MEIGILPPILAAVEDLYHMSISRETLTMLTNQATTTAVDVRVLSDRERLICARKSNEEGSLATIASYGPPS